MKISLAGLADALTIVVVLLGLIGAISKVSWHSVIFQIVFVLVIIVLRVCQY